MIPRSAAFFRGISVPCVYRTDRFPSVDGLSVKGEAQVHLYLEDEDELSRAAGSC